MSGHNSAGLTSFVLLCLFFPSVVILALIAEHVSQRFHLKERLRFAYRRLLKKMGIRPARRIAVR